MVSAMCMLGIGVAEEGVAWGHDRDLATCTYLSRLVQGLTAMSQLRLGRGCLDGGHLATCLIK